MDWKRQAIRWKKAFWAAITEDDDEKKRRILAARAAKRKKTSKPSGKKKKTRTRAKKTGLNKPVAAGSVYKKLGVKFPAKKQLSLF